MKDRFEQFLIVVGAYSRELQQEAKGLRLYLTKAWGPNLAGPSRMILGLGEDVFRPDRQEWEDFYKVLVTNRLGYNYLDLVNKVRGLHNGGGPADYMLWEAPKTHGFASFSSICQSFHYPNTPQGVEYWTGLNATVTKKYSDDIEWIKRILDEMASSVIIPDLYGKMSKPSLGNFVASEVITRALLAKITAKKPEVRQ